MNFINSRSNFPFSDAVVYSGKFILEAVLTGVPVGESKPVPGGAAAEMKEIFRKLDGILSQVSLDKEAIVSVRLYLQEVIRDIDSVNEVYVDYFATHPPSRRAYGVDLQGGMLVEAAFVAEGGDETNVPSVQR